MIAITMKILPWFVSAGWSPYLIRTSVEFSWYSFVSSCLDFPSPYLINDTIPIIWHLNRKEIRIMAVDMKITVRISEQVLSGSLQSDQYMLVPIDAISQNYNPRTNRYQLNQTNLTPNLALSILTFPVCSTIRTLTLQNCKIGDEGLELLFSHQWACLSYLFLVRNRIGGRALRAFGRGLWRKLTYLNLSGNNIGDQGFRTLSKIHFPSLTILITTHNKNTQQSTQHLQNCNWPSLRNLETNQLHNNPQAILSLVCVGMRALKQVLFACQGEGEEQDVRLPRIVGHVLGDVGWYLALHSMDYVD